MSTLWLKDGKPYLFSADDALTKEECARVAEMLTRIGEKSVLVFPAHVEVRHVEEQTLPSFGQQTLGEYDPGWPTDLMVFASIAFGLLGFVAGGYFL